VQEPNYGHGALLPRTATGHAVTAPPSRLMNSRRFTLRRGFLLVALLSCASNQKDNTARHCCTAGLRSGLCRLRGQSRPKSSRAIGEPCLEWPES
jgi:hypothetical protein